jgi:DnaJ-class molecular chaperone
LETFYDILGVNDTATQDEIKKAYRKKAIESHPDKGGNEDTFKKISEAYDTLGDPEKRAAHDNPQPQMGGFPFNNGGFPPGFEPRAMGPSCGMHIRVLVLCFDPRIMRWRDGRAYA